MYASIGYNPSIREVLNYHEEKVKKRVAECIAAENFVKDETKLSYAEKLFPFELRGSYNDAVRKVVFHTAIKFEAGEEVSNATAAAIGREYMEEMGFGEQPLLIYRHRDTTRAHIHLVSPMIDREGKWIHISKHKLYRSRAMTERLARKYGLRTGPDAPLDIPTALQKLANGLSVLYPSMNRVIEEVIPKYAYTNLEELNAILRLHHIEASRGKEHTLTYRRKGLHYHPLYADGRPAREYLAARRFPIHPTLTNLEERFVGNQRLREAHREPLAVLVGYTLAGKSLSLDALKQALAKQQVDLVTGENAIWFVDHRRKTVFEGASLGKEFSFAALQSRLVSEEAYKQGLAVRQQENLGHRNRHSL